MFQTKIVGKKTHILCSVTIFSKNPAIYEIMQENMVEPDRPQMIIIIIIILYNMMLVLFSCWIIKATDIHSEYVILNAFSTVVMVCERSSVLRFTCIAFLVKYAFMQQRFLITSIMN